MTTIANGARLEWGGYEFGIQDVVTGNFWLYDDYDEAKQVADGKRYLFKMRAVYLTDWFDAK